VHIPGIQRLVYICVLRLYASGLTNSVPSQQIVSTSFILTVIKVCSSFMIIIFVSSVNKILPFFCKLQSLILLSIIIICFCSTKVCYCISCQSEKKITCTCPGEGSILLKYLIKLASNYFYIACLLSLFLFNPLLPVLKF